MVAQVKRFSLAKLLYWLLGLIAVAIVALSLLLSFLDWNQYREPLARLASNQLGMRVELAGNVSVAVFPRPSISAATVSLAPAAEGYSDVIATAGRIGVDLGIASLLRGVVSLESMSFDGLDLVLQQGAEGNWRVRGWPSASDTQGPTIELLQIQIKGSRTTLIPYGSEPISVEGVSLSMEGTLPGGPLSWDGEMSIAGETVKTNGRVRKVLTRNELYVKGDFFLGENNLAVTGRIQETGDLNGRLELSGSELGSFLKSISHILQRKQVAVPNMPFHFDLQWDQKGSVGKLVSRELTISDTRGRLDLMVARKNDRQHVTGNIALGVINFDEWLKAMLWPEGETIASVPVKSANSNSILNGTLDINIEGFQVRNGLGQRIDALIAFDKEGILLKRASALLPGATTAAFTGSLGLEAGKGEFFVESGNISDFASWLGLAFPEGIATGRLSTTKFNANFTLAEENWKFSNIIAAVDSSNVKGDVSGRFTRTGPWKIKLEADAINFDAYLPKREGKESETNQFKLHPEADVTFDVSIGELNFLNKQYSDLKTQGRLRAGKLTVSTLNAVNESGNIGLIGSLDHSGNDTVVDVSAQFNAWRAPLMKQYVPDLSVYLNSLNANIFDGTLTVIGPLNDMRLGLDIATETGKLNLNGALGLEAKQLEHMDLQGQLTHQNLAGLIHELGMAEIRSLPVNTSLAIQKETGKASYTVKLGGEFAKGNLTADIIYESQIKEAKLAFTHARAGDLFALTGVSLDAFDAAASIRSEFLFSQSKAENNWRLDVVNFRNGDVSVTGGVDVSATKILDGAFKLEGAVFDFSKLATSRGNDPASFLKKIEPYSGYLSVDVSNSSIAGQNIEAPNIRLILGDSVLSVDIGQNAHMNGAPVSASINVDLMAQFNYSGILNAVKVDIDSFLQSTEFKPFLSAETSFNMEFAGNAGSHNIWSSLKATGETKGGIGALHFLSVQPLMLEMQNATSGKNFLGKIGSMLRSGTTAFDNIETNFTLDGGTLLLEHANAAGTWGELTLAGQMNLLDEYLRMNGNLALSTPPDTPPIPVMYEGPISDPSANWSSRFFERFVISQIERRLRAQLFQEMEERSAKTPDADTNPGIAVFSRAFSLLEQLKQVQEKKKLEEAAKVEPEGVSQ